MKGIFTTLCGLTLAFSGFSVTVDGEQLPGKRTGPFLFSINSDKVQYEPGEPIVITSVLRNDSEGDLSLAMSDRVRFYGMEIRLPAPDWLPFRNLAVLSEEGRRTLYPGHISSTKYILTPGDEMVDHFDLRKLYLMPLPGEYRVIFYFRDRLYVGEQGLVKSNEVVFAVNQ